MSEIYKTEVGELYFSSCSVVGWLDVFVRREYQDILVDSFKFCQKEKELEIFAYCIMPSHFHLIARGKEKKLNEILRDFKSFTAKKVIEAFENNPMESRKERLMKAFEWYGKHSPQKQKYQFWKHDSHSFYLYSNKMIQQKVDYIHQNPVVCGFVNESFEWRLSSANPQSPIKVLEL